MKAEDTVMSDEQIGDRMIPSVSPFHSGKLLARAQAEISFRASIKEAWKEEIQFLDGILHLPFFEFCLQVKERKQKLEQLLK